MSSTAWNLAFLQKHIQSLPTDQRVLLATVASMDRSNVIFHYHLYTARDVLKGFLDDSEPIGAKNIKVVLGVSDKAEVNFAYTVSEAHLELKEMLGVLLKSHWFKYTEAFINTTKHRNLVEHSVSVSFEENKAGVQLGEFKYQSASYPKYWAQEILAGLVDVKNDLVACGRALNRACAV